MASVELLKVSHNVEGRVICIGEGVQGIGDKVQEVDEGVQDVRDAIQDVGDGVRDVRDAIQDVGDGVRDVRDVVQDVGDGMQTVQQFVQGLDDKVGQVNREASPNAIALTHLTQQFWQGITSETAFEFGSLLRTHPLIITLHATLSIRDQLNGSFMVPFLVNGNPLVHSYGYMENVRPSYSLCPGFDHLQPNSGLGKEHTLVRPPLSRSAFRDLHGRPVPQSSKIS